MPFISSNSQFRKAGIISTTTIATIGKQQTSQYVERKRWISDRFDIYCMEAVQPP